MQLDEYVKPSSPFSIRTAFKGLDPKARLLVDYSPNAVWEQDTASLPTDLAKYRRRMKHFAETVLAPHALNFDLDPHGAEIQQILKAAAQAGIFTDYLPSPLGSASFKDMRFPLHWRAAIKMEELCCVCGGLGLLLGAHGLGMMPILLSGSITAIRKWLLPVFQENNRGTPHLMAFGITEPAAGSDVEEGLGASCYQPKMTAKKTAGGWLLNGRKVFISGGDIAKSFTIFAALEKEGLESWTCFFVPRETKGFSRGRNELKMGQRASSATELLFEDAFVPDAQVVGGLRQGWGINRAVLNFSRIPVGSIALGIARGAMENAIQFVCHHQLGGKPLIEYQEVQLAVAQMLLDTSAMRALVWQSAQTWTPTQTKASMTKVFCGDLSVKVCETAMEIMGNHGLAHTHKVEKAYRDARLTQIYEGTNQINRLAIIEDQMEFLF